MKAYVQQRVRKVLAFEDMDIDSAIAFLKANKYGIIEDDDGTLLTIEELQHVKNFGSKARTEPDNTSSSGGEVSEDSDSELFRFTSDNSEPSSDGDN